MNVANHYARKLSLHREVQVYEIDTPEAKDPRPGAHWVSMGPITMDKIYEV